jgi:hypothetical protein
MRSGADSRASETPSSFFITPCQYASRLAWVAASMRGSDDDTPLSSSSSPSSCFWLSRHFHSWV